MNFFFMVYLQGENSHSFQHSTLQSAEQEAKTLAHFIKGRRMLPADAIDKLVPVLVYFGYKPVGDNFL